MKIPLHKRLYLGRRVLCGEKVSALAREFDVVRDTVAQCATEFLYSLRDFNSLEYRRILRTTRLGQLQSAITLYRNICERAAPGTPELRWHHGLRPATTRSLISAGFECREEVLRAYREGRLEAGGRNHSSGPGTNIGARRIAEIAQWLGEMPPPKARKSATITHAVALLESHGYRVEAPSSHE